jgi:DNA-binding transcriptional LysR family regulator
VFERLCRRVRWLRAKRAGAPNAGGTFPVTLEQLRIFVAVAQMEHFTRAAERLKLSQSAVSGAISSLEAEYRIQLFDRSHRHVELTAVGNVFLAEAEAILARVNLALRRIEDLTELRVGHLSLAASQTVANYWLPSLLQQFHRDYPGVNIDLWHGNSTEVEKRVLRGEVDLGFIEQDAHDKTLHIERVAIDRLVGVIGPRHAWFKRDDVSWAELTKTPWIMREIGSGTGALFEAALIEHGVPLDGIEIALTLRTGEAVLGVVASSDCAAVVSELVAATALKAGTLHRIDAITIERDFAALSLPARLQPQTAIRFQEAMRVFVRKTKSLGGSPLITVDDHFDRRIR